MQAKFGQAVVNQPGDLRYLAFVSSGREDEIQEMRPGRHLAHSVK